LFADRGFGVRVAVGDATLCGINPCQRCVVPSRHPDTGATTDGFRERFVRKRRETLPEWTETDRFDHGFRVMVNTVVPERSWGTTIGVGDAVEIEATVEVDGEPPEAT
jgi:uncharacterized protein YcbX